MAQKRMFSKKIVDSDAFLEMPPEAQFLYFHLVMRADDEGFIGNPKRIIRMIGSNENDLRVLLSKRFILIFESGVIVIKHWLIHNTIRLDRFNKTTYEEEKKTIGLKENKAYTEINKALFSTGNLPATQDKLSKVKLSKDKIGESSLKKAKAFYDGQEMRFFKSKWWVIPLDGGKWLEYVGDIKDIEWR